VRATAEAERAAPCQPGQVKGNRESLIYHAPGQRDYEKTRENVQCFDSGADAQAAGYRAAER
jgi:methylphosphotriester-DNA--protein-cysteine methyltransferase